MKCPYRVNMTETVSKRNVEFGVRNAVHKTQDYADCYMTKCQLYDRQSNRCVRAMSEDRTVRLN
jgi:hypothetical protein